MSTTKIPLSLVSVASPCTASWEAMSGDDTARFCGQCAQYVYNLSEMTEKDAEDLILEHEGKMCVRYYKRFDGTMMSKDCSVGAAAVANRRRPQRVSFGLTAVLAVFVLLVLGALTLWKKPSPSSDIDPVRRARQWLFPQKECIMGKM